MIKILKKAMRNPEFDEPGFAWMKIACYLSLTGRTDCCCWLFSVFCCCCFWFFFSENLKLLFLQLGAGEEMEGIFHLALFCLFCQCLCYVENIVFLEGKVIKFIVQKGVYLGSKMKLLCLGACLVCLM